MQFWSILKGCFASYATGVFIIWGVYLWETRAFFRPPYEIWKVLIIFATYGGLIAAVAACIVVVLWLILAYLRITVHYSAAPFTSTVTMVLLLAGWYAEPLDFIMLCSFGMLIGLVFWSTAFGSFKRVTMRFSRSYS